MAGLDTSVSGEFNEILTFRGCSTIGGPCRFAEDTGDEDHLALGFALGAGAEYAITRHFTLGGEYLFVGFDEDLDQSITFLADDGRQFDISSGAGLDDLHVLRIKLNWLLGSGRS